MIKNPKTSNTPASKLAKLGLFKPIDFALHMPLRYEDETKVLSIKQALTQINQNNKNIQIIAKVINQTWEGTKKQLCIEVSDNSANLILRFINPHPAQVKQLNIGSSWRIRGEIKLGFFGYEMIHPIYKSPNIPLSPYLTAIYPSIAGLPQSYLQACMQNQVKQFCQYLKHENDTIPPQIFNKIKDKLNLLSLKQAIQTIHFPTIQDNIDALIQRNHAAWNRIKFDELLAQQLSLKKIQQQLNQYQAIKLEDKNSLLQQFIENLPFELTAGQQKAWQEISYDLKQNKPMQRLLQGDVGSGKTIVAALAASQAVGNGFQVAVMAPTEILAQQLYYKFTQWLQPLNIKIELLISATSAKNKKIIKQNINQGDINILIGTHAIIQKDVEFKNLALAIIDEQHRFGVEQRLALRKATDTANNQTQVQNKEEGEKIQNNIIVHQLMMSATPIPRSLALSYYANLDISIMKGLPHGRKPITTKLIEHTRRQEVINKLSQNIEQGKQIYWVCPLIEESEALDLENAQHTFELLCQVLPNNIRIELMHGKLSAKIKQEIMQKFKEHTIDILVSTTVIEVGVDVPNASVMIIEHAERFGLAQLHQLRGRVGRGNIQSICILLYQQPLSNLAKQRLSTMYNTQDGFEIAEKDLQIRGAGEMLGSKQSGEALRFADINHDGILLDSAIQVAKQMLEEYPNYADKHLDLWINKKIDYILA